MHINLFRRLNAIGMLLVSVVLLSAFYGQLVEGELPCPLCLLQRVAYVAVLYGLMLNVINGPIPSHYSIITISAFFGAAVSMRQILLHIVPGTPPYGSPFLGYHYYTWAFIVFALVILGTAVIAAYSTQYRADHFIGFKDHRWVCKLAIVMALGITAANSVLAFVECGPLVCADNPVSYWLFS
jgi:disulfide bond formation protein DsbB